MRYFWFTNVGKIYFQQVQHDLLTVGLIIELIVIVICKSIIAGQFLL